MIIKEEGTNRIKFVVNVPDIDVVKLNLPISIVACIFRAVFLHKKVLLVSDKKFLHDHYHKFFEKILHNTFEMDLSITTKILYKLKRKEYQDHVVIGESKEIIQDVEKFIDLNNLNAEKTIIYQFFETIDKSQSVNILKKNIYNVYQISKMISEIARKYQVSELRDEDEIYESLEEINKIKFEKDLLELIVDIVESYFLVQVPMIMKIILKKWKKKEKEFLLF